MRRYFILILAAILNLHAVPEKKEITSLIKQVQSKEAKTSVVAQKKLISKMQFLQSIYKTALFRHSKKQPNSVIGINKTILELTLMVEKGLKSKDPEAKFKFQTVLKKINPSILYKQKLDVQKLIYADYKDTKVHQDSDTREFIKANRSYTNSHAVLELCDLRIIRPNTERLKSKEMSSTVYVLWSRNGSSVSDKFKDFSSFTKDFKTTCTWGNLKIIIDEKKIKWGKATIILGTGKKVIIIDKDGNSTIISIKI